jgi:hypothetical protein
MMPASRYGITSVRVLRPYPVGRDLVLMGRNFGTLNDADFLQKNQVGARSPQPVPYLQKDFAAPVRPEALMGIQRQHPNSCR